MTTTMTHGESGGRGANGGDAGVASSTAKPSSEPRGARWFRRDECAGAVASGDADSRRTDRGPARCPRVGDPAEDRLEAR